jgi:hypothetical protein
MEYRLTYPFFHMKAATFSYDDGVLEDREVTSIMRRYGLKGTFNLNTGKAGTAKIRLNRQGKETDCSYLSLSAYPETYRGMEAATHTFSHPFLDTLPYEKQLEELKKDKENLEKIFGGKVIGSAYPYGTYSQETFRALRELGIRYARTTRASKAFNLPSDFLLWQPTVHHNDPDLFSLLNSFLATEEELALFYCWGHSYEYALEGNFGILERMGEELSQHPEVWLATNGEICTYVSDAQQVFYCSHPLHGEKAFFNPSHREVYLITAKGDRLILPPEGKIAYE